MRPLKCWFQQLCIVLGLKRPPLPPQRDIPLGPISKQTYVTRPYSLKKLYGDNEIKTSRYTLYGFVFQNLAEQAQRIANFYFICIAVVQLFTDSPVTPAISIIPLLFVFAVTMVKQGYEDFLRHKADREVNHKHVEIVSADGHLTSIKARELTVGDIVLCRSNDTFPCDLLLLSSSEQSGDCLVTTASLDGETNLKRFTALEQTKAYDTPDLIVKELRGSITCQQPVDDLYTFNGRISIELEDGSKQTYPLGPNNLVLRGACLRNTDFIYACAVYTGQDTKMTLNSKGKKTKFSQVERKLNLALAMILLFLLICATISCIVKFAVPRQATWYIPSQDITPWIVVQAFLGFVVLYNYIIPISLYVTIEVQKFFGSMFFEWDLAMYDSKSNAKARVNTSDLIEEMGQIEYLFTDKTGTLTENCMRFRLFATAFGAFSVKDAMIYKLSNQSGRQLSLISDLETALGDQVDLAVTNSELEADGATEMRTSIRTLLLILALCHTIRVEHPLPGEKVARKHKHKRKHREPESSPAPMVDILAQIREPPKRGGSALRRASAVQAASAAVRASLKGRKFKTDDYIYQASSPDEKAFVEACRDLGIVYHGVDQDGMQVVTLQTFAVRYRLLDVLEFDAVRKCMTVILQPAMRTHEPHDSALPVIVLTKGAETALLARVASDVSDFHQDAVLNDPLVAGLSSPTRQLLRMHPDEVMKRVTAFANSGLRTLVMGARVLSPEQWHEYKSTLDAAKGQLEGRDDAISKAYGQIESQLVLIGCTGVEDMLQDGVAETITALHDAGLKVWVLTGDKEETAVNISYAAGHFNPEMKEIRITKQTNCIDCNNALDKHIAKMAEARVADLEDQFAAVIDGQSLGFALDIRLRDKLAKLLLETTAVLCCRLTPLQKAEVVRLIKESRSPSPVTAAIGDGANDVSMILEAHVSFGVFGKEGRQAARAADYAFARFRFLKRAILFHGHVYYVRVAILVLYFFYKNLLFTLPQFFFEFFCFFSSQTVYPEVYLIFFNITMTSLPIFLFGIFEIPIPEATLLRHPSLYREIVRNRCLSKSTFVLWLGLAIWHSLVAFFGAYFLASLGQAGGGTGPVSGYGGSAIGGLVDFGNFLLMTIFITVNVKVFCFSYTINWAVFVGHLLAFLGNLAIFLFMNFYLFPMQTAAQLYYTLSVLWGGSGLGTAWFGMLCLILLALIPDLTLRGLADQGWVWRLEQMERKEFCSDDSVNSKQPASRQPQRESRGSHQQRPHGEQSTDSVGKVHSRKTDYINPSFEWNNGDALPRVEELNYARGSRQPVEGVFNHENVPPLPSSSEPRVKHLPFHVIGGGQSNRCVIVP